jgi:sugar/nucleoside kinase (ribokinase family)
MEKIFILGKILEDNIVDTSLEMGDHNFCLPLREKTIVKNCLSEPGGGAVNGALSFKKLGFDSVVCGMAGKDLAAENARSKLRKLNIKTNLIGASAISTGRSIIVLAKSKAHVALVYSGANSKINRADFDAKKMKKCRWWFIFSWGNNSPKISRYLSQMKQKFGVHLAFNPGGIQLKKPKNISSLLSATDILFVNEKELEMLLGKELNQGDYKEALNKVVGFGPKIVVLTLGKNGSMVYNGAHFYEAPIHPIRVSDGLGAGDAYNSAFLAWFIRTGRIEEAIIAGTLNSAFVVSESGSTEGQLNIKELAKLMKKEKVKVQVSQI